MADTATDEDAGYGRGLSSEEFPGFPADSCPAVAPDLSKHHSSLADVFRADASLYERCRLRQTSLGVGLARCIKVGMDNRGHRMVKVVGLSAGDEECYETFRELFDATIRRHLEDLPPGSREDLCQRHTTDLGRGVSRPSETRADPAGKYVLSSQVRAWRNLRGFRFPSAMSLEERLEVERLVSRALLVLPAPVQGEYLPLRGSNSHAPRPGGMSTSEEEALQAAGLLFDAPDSSILLSTGSGRHWPQGRGVYASQDRSLAVWVNEQEHLLLFASEPSDAVQSAFRRCVDTLDALAVNLRRSLGGEADVAPERAEAEVYAHSDRLGYLTSSPANLGLAMQVCVVAKLPLLGAHTQVMESGPSTGLAAWRAWCTEQRVQVRVGCDATGAQLPGTLEFSNMDRLGASEVQFVDLVVEVVCRLVQMEQRLEAGHPIEDLLDTKVELSTLGRSSVPAEGVEEAKSKALSSLLLAEMTGVLPQVVEPDMAEGATDLALDVVLEGVTRFEVEEGNQRQEADTIFSVSRPITAMSMCTNGSCATVGNPSEPDSSVNGVWATELVGHLINAGLRLVKTPSYEPPGAGEELVVQFLDAGAQLAKVPSAEIQTVAEEPRSSGLAMQPAAPSGTLELQLRPCTAKVLGPAQMLLEAISVRDRKIGELSVLIREVAAEVAEREESCKQLEDKIFAWRQDAEHLNLDAEWHRQALAKAEDRGTELRSGQRRMMADLDLELQKIKRCEIENGGLMATARSDMSTAAGSATFPGSSGTSLCSYVPPPTPRSIYSAVLEPLAPRK